MGIVYGMLTVIAGAVYLLWQAHKEAPGLITGCIAMMLGVAAFLMIPYGFILIIQYLNLDEEHLIVLAVLFVFAYMCFFVYIVRRLSNLDDGSAEIMVEVSHLPPPDAETLRRYKIANKIPLYPEDDETYNAAAYQAWWNDEYNKRLKKRNKIIIH